MMQEARLIVPIHYHAAEAFAIERILLETFGGWTQTHGAGMWRDEKGNNISEPVRIYDIACEQCLATIIALKDCARILLDAGESAVYIRWPNGKVHFATKENLDSLLTDDVSGAISTDPEWAAEVTRLRKRREEKND